MRKILSKEVIFAMISIFQLLFPTLVITFFCLKISSMQTSNDKRLWRIFTHFFPTPPLARLSDFPTLLRIRIINTFTLKTLGVVVSRLKSKQNRQVFKKHDTRKEERSTEAFSRDTTRGKARPAWGLFLLNYLLQFYRKPWPENLSGKGW
jgi:hypothetical protein